MTVSNMEANDKPSPAIQCLENFLNYLEAKGKSYSDIVIGKTDKNGDRNLRLDYITDGFTYFSVFYSAPIPQIDRILAQFSERFCNYPLFKIKNDPNADYRDATYLFMAIKHSVESIDELN